MSWLSSWLPSIPSIQFPIPVSIQGRFVSFLLKRSLGYLFKPGQLDTPQIDSQIGSGYVQINDLELNSDAINAYLTGIPVVLEEGSVRAVTARIPWPNPLTSTIGFSLDSLNLKFRTQKPVQEVFKDDIDLADSVVSMAETFVQEGLSYPEETTLWESVHSAAQADISEGHAVPGGLGLSSADEEEEWRSHELDPAGVSMFATMIERLLARFEFDARDIQVTVVDPDNLTLRFSLSEIRYLTSAPPLQDPSANGPAVRRTLTLDGIAIYTTKRIPSCNTPDTPSANRPPSRLTAVSSPRSSTSSLDEDAQFLMSQSLAALPPRSSSPAESTSSSIYHSILSDHRDDLGSSRNTAQNHSSPVPPWSSPEENHENATKEEMVLSFGSIPVQIHLTTPSPSPIPSPGTLNVPHQDNVQITLDCGFLASALQPWQIGGLVRMAEKFAVIPTTKEPKRSQKSTYFPQADLEILFRGISVLLLPPPSPTDDDIADIMSGYFSHPLVPPKLPDGYTRALVESITAKASLFPGGFSSSVSFVDVSVFQFMGFAPSRGNDSHAKSPVALPVLISDPYLPLQYDPIHAYPSQSAPFPTPIIQPTLQLIDWSDKKYSNLGAKISSWRSRHYLYQRHRRPTSESQPAGKGTSNEAGKHEPALSCSFRHHSAVRPREEDFQGRDIEVTVAALHLCVDLEMAQKKGSIFWFVQELLSEESLARRNSPEISPIPETLSDPKGLDFQDNRLDAASPQLNQRASQKMANVQSRLSVTTPMIRVSVRAPPPPGHSKRSGILGIDLHNILLSDQPPSTIRNLKTRFEPSVAPHRVFPATEEPVSETVLAQFQCQRIAVGCSGFSDDSAMAIFSVGPLTESQEQAGSSLAPRITIAQSKTDPSKDNGTKTAIRVEIPSTYVAVSKDQWDALQYWIDDFTQALENLNAAPDRQVEGPDSKVPSLVGSRYFAKSRTSSTMDSQRIAETGIKTFITLNLTEFFVRINVPRADADGVNDRPFDLSGSDMCANVELHAGGKLVANATFMDAQIQDMEPFASMRTFLSLTAARSLTSLPQPMVKLRFISSIIPETTAKETKLVIALSGFTFNAYPELQWLSDLGSFFKSPPGTFDSVVPSERTCINVKIVDGSVRAFAPVHPGAVVLSIGGLHLATDIIGESPDSSFRLDISAMSVLAIENTEDSPQHPRRSDVGPGVSYWKALNYALLTEISATKLHYQENKDASPEKQVLVDGICLKLHLCADTLSAITAWSNDLSLFFNPPLTEDQQPKQASEPVILSRANKAGSDLTSSVDDMAFRRIPEIGPAPDMIYDDLPTNLDYLDESFGAAAGLRELTDDDLDEFDTQDVESRTVPLTTSNTGVISSIGGETIKISDEAGINIIEDYYDDLPYETIEERPNLTDESLRVRVRDCNVTLLLYDGYDWPRTRKTIEEEVKEMRKRLAKIRQLVASGQTQSAIPEDTSALLFNSVYIGLHQDVDAAEPDVLLAAIDEELRDDFETGTQSSWQTLKHPSSGQTRAPTVRIHGKRLTRSKGPSIEFCLFGLNAELNKYGGENILVSRTFVTVKDLEILDHIKTSTWKKFLTTLRSDSKGNVRETGANMVRIELHSVRPSLGHSSEEARLRAKILPLRLYVDQDAVDFLKKFFSFKDPNMTNDGDSGSTSGDAYIQMAEIFPIDLKLDYKPRRVDYRALREGRTIELMNFFHFDGAEMTLRHITLSGITGWPNLFEMLNDLWTPDVKATQLVDVISGVAPIRSMVNVGSGVADLVLLPISQYKKDGRIVRGVQKGATAFVKSTAIEAIKMGARLATGTQVILEQAEGLLGGEFDYPITTETVQPNMDDDFTMANDASDDETNEPISKYAHQPADIKEGVQSAYKSLQRNLSSAAQTILAVPMEVYERSGNEGPVRSVIRAVPIAVLKPMIGASEAVSKTLLGLHNTLDPNVRHENEAKYKNR